MQEKLDTYVQKRRKWRDGFWIGLLGLLILALVIVACTPPDMTTNSSTNVNPNPISLTSDLQCVQNNAGFMRCEDTSKNIVCYIANGTGMSCFPNK